MDETPCGAPPRTEIQTCVEGTAEGLHRWACHACNSRGPAAEDGLVCKRQLIQHLREMHPEARATLFDVALEASAEQYAKAFTALEGL